MDILPVFCDIDDFCQFFEPLWKRRLLSSGYRQRDRAPRLCLSKVMTIIVMFHSPSYRNFKAGGIFNGLARYRTFFRLERL